MEFKVLDKKGKVSAKTISASDATFGKDFNEALIHQLVSSYNSKGRSVTISQKTRA
jgi:large subunit ribosomal protein L4